MVSLGPKLFSVELKKKISSIFNRHNLELDYSIIYYITNARIVFSILLEFNLYEFIPDITEQVERLFYLVDLCSEGWNENFHYNTLLAPASCYYLKTDFKFFNENVKEKEWALDDKRIIKSFAFSL